MSVVWISEVSVEWHFLLPLCFVDNHLFKTGAKSCGQPIWLKLGTEVGGNEIFEKPIWFTCLTFSFGVSGPIALEVISTFSRAPSGINIECTKHMETAVEMLNSRL